MLRSCCLDLVGVVEPKIEGAYDGDWGSSFFSPARHRGGASIDNIPVHYKFANSANYHTLHNYRQQNVCYIRRYEFWV